MKYNKGPVTLRSMPFWCVGNPLGDPFGSQVLKPLDSIKLAEILKWSANQGLIEATGFHDDDLVEWDPERPNDDMDPKSETSRTIRAIKKILDNSGLTVNTATCNLHGNPIFRRGGLTNPDRAIRDLARRKVERSIRMGNMLGARHFTYWVARDGFEAPVTVDWNNVYKWLGEGLNAAVRYIENQRFSNYRGCTIEPKPNEPRGHMFLPSAGHAVGFIYGFLENPDFWGVNPELLQHESMALLNSVHTVGYLVALNKLAFLHFGSQIKAQFDNDFPPLTGPEGLKETVQMFWALEKMGWKGVVEFDCHMLRTEGDPDDPIGCRKTFVRNCAVALDVALNLASRLKGFKAEAKGETENDLAAVMKMCNVRAASFRRKP